MKEKIRLNRYLARAGICSRRQADELIKKGCVKVNGTIIKTLGIKIDINDEVLVNGKKVFIEDFKNKNFIYIALYKPIKVVTTLSDPQKRRTILDILPKKLQKLGLVPVGRLDYFSEGLLILSNDGDFVYKMTHPKFHLKKTYIVQIKGVVQGTHLEIMKKGMELPCLKSKLAPVNVQILNKIDPAHFVLKFELMQGINRQIRRMCHAFGWKVMKLKRIMHGPVKLGNLKPGEFRYLSEKEIKNCFKSFDLTTKRAQVFPE